MGAKVGGPGVGLGLSGGVDPMSAAAAYLGMNFDNMPGVGGSATPSTTPGTIGATEEQPVYNSTHEFTKMMNELEVTKAKDFNNRRRAEREAKRARVNEQLTGAWPRSRESVAPVKTIPP